LKTLIPNSLAALRDVKRAVEDALMASILTMHTREVPNKNGFEGGRVICHTLASEPYTLTLCISLAFFNPFLFWRFPAL
jgi:hypothetical protein